MVTYIYFVKCPNCEDEPFDFFDEAKGYAMGCLSQKPVITQIEVCRNDFGECTDHCDLGTVWSWEEAMKDTEATDTEPTTSIFTKDDFKDFEGDYNPENDPEFASIDNSVDFEPETPEVSALDDIPDNFRKPIPEGMTIEELVEAMEENEDTVECTKCGGLFEKASCHHNKEGFGWCCSTCEPADTLVEEDEPHDLGNTYDGGYPEEYDLATLVKDSINHLTNDLGKDPWAEDFADDVITDLENNYSIYVPEDMDKYNSWCSEVACEVSRQVNNPNLSESHVQPESLKEAAISSDTVDLEYDELTITLCGNQRDADDWDEVEHTDSYTYTVDRDEIKVLIWEKFLTEEDVADVPGGFAALEDDTAWEEFIEENFDTLFDKYHDQILDHYREDAEEEFSENFTFADYDEYWRDFWNDPDADYHSRFDD